MKKVKKHIKRIFVAILILCLTIVPFCPVSAAVADGNEIMPMYNNVSSASANININNSGKMTITYQYYGSSAVTTKAVITTYIEKRTLGLFWKRVDIGTTNDEWVDTKYDSTYIGSRTHQLSSTGTYRVTVVYKIYGTGGSADEIECRAQDSY